MREMHKWKDKVELSLDNRQIFFLFFGLSVVGCFVFALGVMVGRRVDWSTTGEVAVRGDDDALGSLAFLDADAVRERLSFQEGLSVPATEGLAPTRDPESVGKPDPETDVALASAAAGTDGTQSRAKTARGPGKAKSGKAKSGKAKSGKAKSGKGEKTAVKASQVKPAKPTKLKGRFTLQMKAFARPDQAEAFADTLRANGHAVRVEPHEVKGRIWHRVRVGAFKTWGEGLAAKERFESHESVIAYVVRL